MKIYTDRIKTLRKSRGIKVSDLAKELGISINTFYRWERNECTPSMNDIRILAHLLDIDPSVISDLKQLGTHKNIYSEKKLKNLIQRNDLDFEVKDGLLRLDKIVKNLNSENSSLISMNELHKKILDDFLTPVYIKNKNLKFDYYNRKFKISFGSNKKIIGLNNDLLFSKNESILLTKLERSIVQTGVPIENYRIRLNENEYLFFGHRIKYDKHNIDSINIIVNLINIDSYYRTAVLYKDIYNSIENSGVAVWVKKMNPEPHYEYISHSIEKIFGYPYQIIINNVNIWREIIHPDDLGNCIPVEPLLVGDKTKIYEYRILTKDNIEKRVRERISFNKPDKFIGLITEID